MAPQEKHEEVKPVPIQINAPKPVKAAEEKCEKAAVKRQRRQRADTVLSKEEEKKTQVQTTSVRVGFREKHRFI